ncbi:MAG TPA: TRAP transporter small permease [Paracoccus sp. (in: a-proteobacteria)]|uniref:TRAP transporter small permease n=1 Tax=uncultured Paracoccus sp. TaxID=189685 RepID=UPI002631CC65|nr:TRAP transporter small permease [uncultured Paracoccus sp.]HMQ41595.1 TRAP transporter small permease [Paracoccus sp. (in: a-proteobacteria)]HMR36221.1 TRAP transporter small permease [Paracoccus sp. (in: a-proteobacteria)]
MQAVTDARRTRLLDRVTLWLAWLAGLALIFMVVIISTGVMLRYVFGTPLLGLNEINQLTAVVLVMAALPYCTLHNGHVGVDVFDNAIGAVGRLLGDVVSRLLSGFVLSVLVWRAALKALDAWEYEDATNMLDLPVWPFYAVLGIGAALCVLIFAVQLIDILKRGGRA